jgi:alkanesulfonate monooxygenase SsuD/methylene tetrahydromethanopterin reductase-like flavin-dependent oxidoreductase (luciferase family)
MDELLDGLLKAWDHDAIGPSTHDRPGLLIGGGVQASYDRAAKFGDGWISGGAPPDQFKLAADAVRQAWSDAGREGEPRLGALGYFALGDTGEEDAQRYLTDYYSWLGEETAGYIAGSAAKDAETVQAYVSGFTEAGCDELILFPSNSSPDQVDLLADAAGL